SSPTTSYKPSRRVPSAPIFIPKTPTAVFLSSSPSLRPRPPATTFATLLRSATTECPTRGCTAFVSRITYVSVYGSIHIDVPVKPVCPNEPSGNSSPRFDENGESISHPSPRKLVASGGCCGRADFATVNAFKTGWGEGLALISSSTACAYLERSVAVENKPACPATPPMRRAVGSCTTPRSIRFCSSYSVGAMRRLHCGGGRNRVSPIPSGWKTNAFAYLSSGILATRSTRNPRTSKLISLYRNTAPGGVTSFEAKAIC